MRDTAHKAVAIVGVGAVLPDAADAPAFWRNIKNGRYSITDVRPDRWDPEVYYDPDPKVPDKSYSKIGGWVREWEWDPLKWRLPIPPRVSASMDLTQKLAVVVAREALSDYGYPSRPLDAERTAVILGNAMAGDNHLYSAARVLFAEYAEDLSRAESFAALPADARKAILSQLSDRIGRRVPEINEDTMPGELANIIAGRIAALYDFKGPNYVADAACASAMAGITAAIAGLVEGDFDAVLTGGIDANMSPSTYVKFCKIGALSATGARPFAEGADGFVMGEGAVIFLLKRLAEAERDGDKIYAVIRGLGGSSDGRGKGITAPNPAGQKLCIRRAWENSGVEPSEGDLIEGHGTSTPVGDVAEVQSLVEVFAQFGLPEGSIALGSVKSNIGHLKGAAGAAGILKAVFALHEKVLPPSLNFHRPNHDIDFTHSPLRVNTELRPWEKGRDSARRAGVSAFGFGGTNFHAVLEEYIPGRIKAERKLTVSVPEMNAKPVPAATAKVPLRGALLLGAESEAALVTRLKKISEESAAGVAPAPAPPWESDLRAPHRLSIDYGDAAELADKCGKALKAFEEAQAGRWKALRAKGIFLGKGPAPKVAFLFTGQGSQYVNMLKSLRDTEPVIAEAYAQADSVMKPLLGRALSEYIFRDEADAAAMAEAETHLKQTAITQPAVLATETALARLLGTFGIFPDMAMGHSLGEYGALVASGALSFDEALRAVSARGAEMTRCAMGDNGLMAAVFGPIDEIAKVLSTIDGYVVIANINSTKEAVIGGATEAVEKAMVAVREAGYVARALQVSHAFHTSIVAPASEALAKILSGMNIRPPGLPIISNVTGEFYPMGSGVEPEMIQLLGKQVASPVQFVKGLNTLYQAGARIFVELGPKRVLYGFVEDVLGEREGVVPLFTNHPRIGEAESVNLALCGLYAAGLGIGQAKVEVRTQPEVTVRPAPKVGETAAGAARITERAPAFLPAEVRKPGVAQPSVSPGTDRYVELGRLFVEFLERGMSLYSGARPAPGVESARIFVTGASLGLPGVERVFDDSNVERILRGDQFIDAIPMSLRTAMVEKNITRLVKTGSGEGRFETIENLADVIKLAARAKDLDLCRDFGFPEDRLAALDRTTRLAIGAGIDAMRDAGIPLVMHYKTTTRGTKLPDRWMLPEAMRDDTGVLFTSAFPGYDSYEEVITGYYQDRIRRERLEELSNLRASALRRGTAGAETVAEIDRRISELRADIEANPYHFDRRFLFRVLSMGHSQFAEYIGARGPNTATNAACASGTQAVAIAADWIRMGRCRRVIVISADDITSDNLMGWFGSGFLASGAAATDDVVEDAAIPFDRRRHGLIIGMGAAAMVVESLESTQERGIQPICEVLGSVVANSAFHGSRLDVNHICQVMERLVSQAESEWGINRYEIAPQTVFVSHETYTPARGGSASAEVLALRYVFRDAADQIVVANTKGATGHPMAVGIEDVVAVKVLETGIVPPVANFREVDPELGPLNLSRGGAYPVQYALRLGAGFGSQICMTLMRWVPSPDGSHRQPSGLGYNYRIVDPGTWERCLKQCTGYEEPELEVFQRTLRVRDQGPAARIDNGRATAQAAPIPPVAARPAAASPPAVPIAAPAAAPAPAAAEDPVKARVMQIIADKTGYPPDMLALDLDLEADLGIDTVKQAEMFAAIRAAYDIPRDDDLKLRDFPTLGHTIQFVYDRRPDLKAPAAPAPTQVATPQPVSAGPAPATQPGAEDAVKTKVLEIIAEKTGYPQDMLDLDLDLEADLGIDTVKQAEMFSAIRTAYDIPRDDALKLRDYPTLAHAIRFVYDRRQDLKAPAQIAAAQPVPAGPAPATQPGPEDPVKIKILEIIAEKTGYPPDMLDLDLDLEADLGIDTVKQAEMFAAIRAAYDIPRDEALKLRDYPTLAHAIRFVHDRRPDLAAQAEQVEERPARVSAGAAPASERIIGSMEAADRVPRRVPVPRLRPPRDLCKATGVTLSKASRVIVMSDRGGVGRALAGRLEKLGAQVLLIDTPQDADTLAKRIADWKTDGTIQGVYWLPALDQEAGISEMDFGSWRDATQARVKLLYVTMRALNEDIGRHGTFLVAATRMGGLHGYDEAGALAPLGGGVAGFTKAFKREKSEALVKVVDFEPSRKTSALADRLIDETQWDPGAVEIGYRHDRRWTIGLIEQSAADGRPGMVFGKDTVFVITGAAGSIVSAITADLAAASGGTFYLLDLTPEPDAANMDLQRLITDKEGLKHDLFERLKARGERATPAMVEKEIASLERARAALTAIQAVKGAGGTARYYSVNLLDHGAVAGVMRDIAAQAGRIDVLVHAAGLEISHLLADKKPAEFDLVFDVKSDGWFNLLSNVGDMPLGAAVVFSSIAGRFGNGGQTDYSAANDLLCKSVSSFRSSRPGTRGIAIDWTAWSGIGMAARGSIPIVMKEAGIDMLAPQAGIPVVRRELTAGGTSGEVVIAERLGIMTREFDASGGLDATESGRLATMLRDAGVMTGKVTGMGLHQGLTVETTLDPARQPFLSDHQINGTPVLPGVMGIEGLAETARVLFPEMHLGKIGDVCFHSPFKFYRGQPRTLLFQADFDLDGDDIMAHCRLVGSRTLHGQTEPEITTHFTACVRLVSQPADPAKAAKVVPCDAKKVEARDIYRLYFHGPAYQVVESSWRSGEDVVGLFAANLPANHEPAERRAVVSPRLIELCFQTAGLWELAAERRMGLPYKIDEVMIHLPDDGAKKELYAVVRPGKEGAFDARVVDERGAVHLSLRGYRTMQLPDPIDPALLVPLQTALS